MLWDIKKITGYKKTVVLTAYHTFEVTIESPIELPDSRHVELAKQAIFLWSEKWTNKGITDLGWEEPHVEHIYDADFDDEALTVRQIVEFEETQS